MIWLVSSILFLFALLGVIIAAYTLNDYRTVQGRDLGVILLSSSVASFAYGMEILSPGLNEKFTWVVVRYVALSVFTLSNALFVFYFTHIPIPLKSWPFLGLCLLPGVGLFFQATYPLTHLMYDRIWLDTSGPIPMIAKTVGLLYWIFNIYIMGLLVISIYLLLENMARESALIRRQSRIIAAAIILALGTHLMYLGGVRLLGVLNPNLFTYFPAAALILWGTKRYRLADLRPIARTRLLEQLQDGILVVDRAGSLIETNPAAENYLEISGQDAIGKTLKSVSSELAGVLDHYSQKKISTMIQFNSIPLQVTISPLVVRRGEDDGFLIILRDISDRLEAEKLKEMEIKRESAWVERKNIARTLHDSINQYLNSLVLLAGTASQRLEQAKYGQMEPVIRNISISVRQASKEMRALITELQLEAPSDRGFELVKALTERVNLISAQVDLHFHLNTPASLDLNSSQQREIFYIVLETLNNILQHAHANTVSIGLKQIEGQFIAEICDDGCGFDPGQLRDGGMGLANIKERTRLLNGALSISSMPGSGTCIRLALQLTPAKEETQ